MTKLTKSGADFLKEAEFRPAEDHEFDASRARGAARPGSRPGLCEEGVASVARFRRPGPKPDVADEIGRGLRNIYDDVLSQPVPDRFFDLLRQLERSPQLKKGAM